eukprot:7966101-Alexandrium_andersonii.AAC.1
MSQCQVHAQALAHAKACASIHWRMRDWWPTRPCVRAHARVSARRSGAWAVRTTHSYKLVAPRC